MQCFLLIFVIPACVAFLGALVTSSINCIKACNEVESSIVCNQSLILISDVTNWNLEKNYVAFENMKRDCMGRESCDPSKVCGPEYRQSLVVHYLCVDAGHIRSKSCNGHTVKMKGNSGYIQSPGYPEMTSSYVPCKWQIDPANDNVVVLSLHDVVVSGSIENCDGGLIVNGHSCDGGNSVFVRRMLCGGDNLTSLVRCGKVDIELSNSERVYPLRFWLSFHVHSKSQPSSFQVSLLPCSGWIYDTNSESKHSIKGNVETESTPVPAASSTDVNTEVLIIMLSIISGLSAVLLIILIVVCIRCHLLQAPHGESMFSDSSAGLRAHYKYISSLDSEKSRPQLADGYFEVADALPLTQRGETPTSPAYADVELIAQLRKALWSSSSEDGIKGCKPSPGEMKQAESELNNGEQSHLDHDGLSPEVSKQKKHERDNCGSSKRQEVVNKRSAGTKIKAATKGKEPSLNNAPESHIIALEKETSKKDTEKDTANEKSGEVSYVNSCLDKRLSPASRRSQSERQYVEFPAMKCSTDNNTRPSGRVKDHTSIDNSTSTQRPSLLPEVTLFRKSSLKDSFRLNKTPSSEGSKVMPNRNVESCSKTSKIKSSNQNNGLQGAAAKKKGVKTFEHNGSLA